MADERKIVLRGDHVTLAQAIKIAGLADTGGRAKMLVRDGGVLVNGAEETRPARKLRAGDKFSTAADGEWSVIA